MHNRLIFLYHRVRAHSQERSDWRLSSDESDHVRRREAKGGRRRVSQPRRWLSWGKRVEGPIGKSVGHNLETRCRTVLGEVTDPMLPRKASSELARCPYPKPTQVGT